MRNDKIVQNLGRLLRAGDLPPRVSKQAQHVYDALTHTKRVTIMGPPKSGKHDVLALLAGNRVVGSDLQLGAIKLVYGEQAKTTMTLANGSTHHMAGVPSAMTLDFGVVPVETVIEAPLAALRKVTLMRLPEANDMQSQIDAMLWASEQSDIVIWCTTNFGPIEYKMWVQMPEAVRDHAFVLRTTLEEFNGDMAAARSDLGKRARDEFAFVLAADLRSALSAQVSVPVDTAAMKASGGTTLISTLLKEIDEGLQNATDQAELILAKYGEAKPKPAPVAEAPKAAPKAEPEPEKVVESAPAIEPKQDESTIVEAMSDLAGGKVDIRRVTARASAKQRPQRKDPGIFPTFELGPDFADKTPAKPEAGPDTHTLPETAIVMFNDMIAKLSALGATVSDENDHRPLFDASLETLSWMDESLEDAANDDFPQFAHLQGITEEATDLIHLLKMENTDSAALDAATILLQVKRSLHGVLAA